MPEKNWEKIVAELSSGEDSDEYDTPNIAAVKKNGAKLIHLAAQLINENVPPKLVEPQSKAREAGKGTVPQDAVSDFKSVGAAIASHTFSSSLPSQSESVQATGPGP